MIDFVIPLADWVNFIFKVVNYYLSPVMRSLSSVLEVIIQMFEDILLWPPESVSMLIMGLLIWCLAGKRLAFFAVLGLLAVFGMQIWEETIATIALALSGTVISLIFGIPLGMPFFIQHPFIIFSFRMFLIDIYHFSS